MGRKSSGKMPILADQDIEGFIAEGTSLSGDLMLDGGFRVDGRVAGRVHSKSTLIVGPPGEIEADDLRATNLLVSGTVRGKLHVDDRLEIQPGGKVFGEVTMTKPGLVVAPGGRFEGTVNMKRESEAATPTADEKVGATTTDDTTDDNAPETDPTDPAS